MLLSNRRNLAQRLPSRAASCQERLLLWWHTRRKRSVCARTHTHTHTHTHTQRTQIHTPTQLQACAANTHTCSHTQMHTRMLTARRDVWRERTPAISSPVLPACSGCPTANLLSPQPVTLKSKCQPVTFLRHLTLKCSPFFPSISEGRERDRPSPACLSLWHSSPPTLLAAPCTFG